MAENLKHVTNETFEAFLTEHKLAVVDFWATWCGPCRMVGPVIEALSDDYSGRVSIGKVDVDEQGALAQRFGVMSIPTVVLFENGKEIDRKIGAMPKEEYQAMIDAHL